MLKIGIQFQEDRKKRNITLEEASLATKIKKEFLSAIEKGEYDKLPSPAYASGFVRNYAKYLGLPVEKSMALFRREFDVKKSIDVLPKGFSDTNYYAFSKLKIARGAILVFLVLFFVIGFLTYQYRSAFFDPGLSVSSPKEGEVVTSLTVEVKGKTDPDSTLYIDNQDVAVEKDGGFSKSITVFPGETTINFVSENRFGRVTTLKRNIIVNPNY